MDKSNEQNISAKEDEKEMLIAQKRKRHVALAVSLVIGILGATFTMLGSFGDLHIAITVIFIIIGLILMAVGLFSYYYIIRINTTGRFLKLLISIDAFFEKNLSSHIGMYYNFTFALIKIGIGIFTNSYFFVVSAMYSVCMGFAKMLFLRGMKEKAQDEDTQYKYYVRIAFLILTASIIYIVYMTRLFFVSSQFNYGMTLGILIAAVAFFEFIMSLINLKKHKGIVSSAGKLMSLTASFFAISLTQIAILSFADENVSPFYNALGGVVFGGLSAGIAIYMIIKYVIFKNKNKIISPKVK